VWVPSAQIFGLFFHLKTCGLAEKSIFEDFGTIFEKQSDYARSGFECFFKLHILKCKSPPKWGQQEFPKNKVESLLLPRMQ
jgi:hypothetical protein